MSKLDNEEKKIYNMLSQINVDSSNISKQVKNKLHKRQTIILAKNHKPWVRSTVATIVLFMFLVVGATAAVLGNFEWFMEKFNPSFGSIVEPIEVYSEDQGIRMEVIGAQKYDNRAIVYLSLKDMTGQNRLTERTDFRDGFNVKMGERNKNRIIGMKDLTVSGFSWRQKMIYFDEVTNTAYYEFNITTDLDTSLADPLELGSSLIYFDEKTYEKEPINISLIEVKDSDTVLINESQIWGGRNVSDNKGLYTMALSAGNYASMPHGEKDQWISNIGIIDGKLHVQIGNIFSKEFGSNDATIDLKNQDGSLISSDYSLVLLADERNNFLDLERNDYADAAYKYEEFVFPINVEEHDKYTLFYTGAVYSGVEGNWKVTADLGDSTRNILAITDDILIDGHIFEYITLSPLGLQGMGTYEEENCHIHDMIVKIETVDGTIQLEGGSGSQNSKKHRFNVSWDIGEPLEVTKVKAIIINDTRIPIK
jgi:ACT domain-containing protein